tara:strand:- start:2771 stop:3523 length:753 start_codon:yes stop_codon:yes gene_type:complete
MAINLINVGTENQGDGDPLRNAFVKANSMFTELYDDDAADVNSITATAPIERDTATGAVTISLADAGISTAKIADDAVTADKLANSINTEIAANTAKTTNATHTGDVTGSAALTIASDAVTTAKILNDNVTHDKLENRYTASGSITTYTSAVTVDWSAATNYVMGSAITGAIEFDFTNFKTGQVLTIHNLTGSFAIELDSNAATSETFNKLGAKDYDGSTTNALMIECISDSANAVFNYSVLTYASSVNP